MQKNPTKSGKIQNPVKTGPIWINQDMIYSKSKDRSLNRIVLEGLNIYIKGPSVYRTPIRKKKILEKRIYIGNFVNMGKYKCKKPRFRGLWLWLKNTILVKFRLENEKNRGKRY